MENEYVKPIFDELAAIASNHLVEEGPTKTKIKGEKEVTILSFQHFLKNHRMDTDRWLKIQSEDPSDWTISINKTILLKENIQLFLEYSSFISWLSSKSPIERNFFNETSKPKKIYFKGEGLPLSGRQLLLIPLKTANIRDITDSKDETLLPHGEKIKKYIHYLENDIIIAPLGFYLTLYDEKPHSLILQKCFIQSLCASLATEVIDHTSIRVKGRKTVRIRLEVSTDDPSTLSGFMKSLCEIIEWVYEGNSDTRLKLVADSLSLDLLQHEEHSDNLIKLLPQVLSDAKEKYTYFISEKTDEFNEDKRRLHENIQSIITLYNDKLRTQINSLLRDILASVFLVGIGFITRTKEFDLTALMENNGFDMLMKALSMYLVVSISLQSIFGLLDARESRKELFSFSLQIRSSMSQKDSENYIKSFLERREVVAGSFLFAIVAFYLSLAYFCWNITILAPFFIN